MLSALGGAGSRCQLLCPDQWEHHSGYAVKPAMIVFSVS